MDKVYSTQQLMTIARYAAGNGCQSIPCKSCSLAWTFFCKIGSLDETSDRHVMLLTGDACAVYVAVHPELFTAELLAEAFL